MGCGNNELDEIEAFAYGLDPDGTLACLSTLSGAELGDPDLRPVPSAVTTTASGVHVTGFVMYPESAEVELLEAKLR